MAIAVEHVAGADAGTVAIVPAGSDRLLLTFHASDDAGDTAIPLVATFKTTEIVTEVQRSASANGQASAVGRLIAPTTGSGTLAGNYAATAGMALSGVDQTTPISGLEMTEANAASPTLGIASGVGDLVVGSFCVNNGSPPFITASGDSPTVRLEQAVASGGTGLAIVTCPGAAGDVNIGGSWSSARATQIAFNVEVAAAALEARASRLPLLGVQ